MARIDDAVLRRITELVSLLASSYETATIQSISEKTGTLPTQTREDLLALHAFGLRLSPSAVLSRLTVSDPRFDDVPLAIDADLPDVIGRLPCLLFLAPAERAAFFRKSFGGLHLKDAPVPRVPGIRELIERTEEAVCKGITVSFRYRPKDEASDITVATAPRLIYRNAADELYYLVAFGEGGTLLPYRLDRIRFGIRLHPDKPAPPVDPGDPRFGRLQRIWGGAFSNGDEPVRVRVLIRPETGNLLRKVRADIAGRPFATLVPQGGDFLYEDEVIGLSAFRSWLLSFGSSVKVLEPESLAASLLDSACRRLLNYREGTLR